MSKSLVKDDYRGIVCHMRQRQIRVDVAIDHADLSPAMREAQFPSSSELAYPLWHITRKHILTVAVSNPAVEIYSASWKAGMKTQSPNHVEHETWSSNVATLSPRWYKRALLRHLVPQLSSMPVGREILGPLLHLLADSVRAF